MFETFETAQDHIKKAVHRLWPDEANQTVYNTRFAAYQQLGQMMAHVGGS